MAIRALSLCAGVGGLDLGCHAAFEHLGSCWRTSAYVEREAYAAAQLVALMEAGCMDQAPIWSDLLTFDAAAWRGSVDCVIAGFPCQPHSVAGSRKGVNDDRWIWPAIVRIIRDSGAWCVVLENVRGLLSSGGMDAVLADLADLGFAAEWTVLAASEVGASHKRERVFIVGVANSARGAFRELRESSRGNGQPDGSDEELAYAASGRRAEFTRPVVGGLPQPDGGVATATELAHASRHERHGLVGESRSGWGVRGDGGALADAQHGFIPQSWRGSQGRNGAGSTEPVLECEFCGYEFDAACGRYGCPNCEGEGLADTSRPRPQGREQRDACDFDGGGGGPEAHGSTAELRDDELFAPGPSDKRWPDILAERPYLAPATQPGIRGLVDGHTLVVDESRRDQLRCLGNGVVPLQAAVAVVQLVRRLMKGFDQ